MPRRAQFDWDEANANHIVRHGVKRDEVEAVIANDPMELDAVIRKGESRRLCIGKTDAGRVLTVVYTIRNKKVRVVTAYPANRDQRRLYESQ